MAKSKKSSDQFTNIVYASATESAANTLTFQQIQTGYGSLQKTGWVINRLEYFPSAASLNQMGASADILSMALTTSNLLASLSLADASMIDLAELNPLVMSGVGFALNLKPYIRDFSMLPGGGRLVLPYPLYLAVKGTDLTNACTVAMRISFTEIDLEDSQWMELVQQTRLLS